MITQNRLDMCLNLSVSMIKQGAQRRSRPGHYRRLRHGFWEDDGTGYFHHTAAPPEDLFEAWRQWHQPVLDFLPQQSTRYGFPAEVHLWKLGGLAMSRASAPPVSVARTKRNLRRDPIDHWVINYCDRGTHFTNTAVTAVEEPTKVP